MTACIGYLCSTFVGFDMFIYISIASGLIAMVCKLLDGEL